MRLQQRYSEQIAPQLQKDLQLENRLAVPVLEKVVLNMGMGQALADKGLIEKAMADLTAIAGQKPAVMLSRKAVASFKLRKGVPIGLKVTLRNQRMYDFVEKLFTIVLPRLRDFQGLSTKSFDGRGNYTMGMTEQIVFPEIDYGKIDRVRGLEITFVTTANDNASARQLLQSLGAPFAKDTN